MDYARTATIDAPVDDAQMPKTRIPDAALARQIVNSRVGDLDQVWAIMDEVQYKLDCNPPDTRQSLKSDGLGHLTNVCWGSLEARISEAVEPIYNLAMGGRHFMKFHTRMQGPMVSKGLDVLGKSHRELLFSWSSFSTVMQTMAWNRTSFGLGILYHPKVLKWQFDTIHPRNLIYPSRASIDITSWPWAAISTSLDVTFLLEQVAKGNKDAGWNYAGIREAIRLFNADALSACDSAMRNPGGYWNTWGTQDLKFSHRENMSIPAFIFFVKEFSGKITEHILLDHPESKYLFSAYSRHDDLAKAMTILPHEVSAGVIAKLRGLGAKSLAQHDAMDRLRNHEVDLAFMSGLILQAADGSSLRKIHEVVWGASVVVPPGLTVQQSSFRDTGAGARALRQDMQSMVSEQSTAHGGAIDVGQFEKSNRQHEQIYTDRAATKMFMVDRFKGQLDLFCQSHWQRLKIDVEAFPEGDAATMFKEAIEDGVPPELLGAIKRVEHYIGASRGNRVSAMMGMDRARTYFGMFSEEGKLEFAKTDMSITFDNDDVGQRWLKTGQSDYDSEQIQKAVGENADMHLGEPVYIAGTDSHFLHLETHTPFVAALIAACEAGREDPQKCFVAIVKALDHCAPEMIPQQPGNEQQRLPGHLSLLAQDPLQEQAVKAFATQWSQIENYRRKLEQLLQQQAAKAQEQQAEMSRQPQVPPIEQEKIITEQTRRQMMIEDHQVSQKIKVESAQTDIEIKKAKAAVEVPAITSSQPQYAPQAPIQGIPPGPIAGSPAFAAQTGSQQPAVPGAV